ncbi:uncharacterized protein F5891DRAFT_979073 [Suillus fuscotomentosus]|uniref:Uncharacterized protein n=1 Tax=Suillus fuscotomentosus TaxID=1912939 RepID=A0AAD4EBK0_9AGAM|nr:uncharacterized protein F5891DRAFT_979073 [Suillus fuscotomentosus]KAG1901954.1 hypothetical protein F5891DRAFT_979073 [Suillus fuscotomentosus]
MAPLLKRIGPRRYTIPSPLGAGLGDSDLVVLVDTVRLYLEYDGHLRAGTASLNATPFGYNDFALAFNMQPAAEADPSRFAIEGAEGPTIKGGRYLNPHRAELMEEALWMNLETAKKKREWRDRSIAERKAKRARPEVSGRPDMRKETHPHANVASASRTPTTSTPGPSSPSSTEPANREHAMDVEEGEERRTEKGKRAEEDASKKTKRK